VDREELVDGESRAAGRRRSVATTVLLMVLLPVLGAVAALAVILVAIYLWAFVHLAG
jgi:sensor domain CHASE-containing protein